MKGMTLIEGFIVLALISILAALVIPRWMMPPERRLAREAQTFLETIRQSQIHLKKAVGSKTWRDASSTYEYRSYNSIQEAPGWVALGFGPLSEDAPFSYECPARLGICTAKRSGDPNGPKFGGTITVDLKSGAFSCDEPYRVMSGQGVKTQCG